MLDLKSMDRRYRMIMTNELDLEFRMCATHKVNMPMSNMVIPSDANSIGFSAEQIMHNTTHTVHCTSNIANNIGSTVGLLKECSMF